ncbi:hypothetical protein GCM10010274_39540 [Streptomyces lavendofoliae]|uniref:Uncharacterized protein n=1 Tax=Streptomyces lavendofoliae TaxID=67314 RepID=A0A918M4Z8_9ACTN|nr:hypothetical protein GCM10010274_39540 [Streptomyces lavendofoliae]
MSTPAGWIAGTCSARSTASGTNVAPSAPFTGSPSARPLDRQAAAGRLSSLPIAASTDGSTR